MAAMTTPTRLPSDHRDIRWTPRQREVLDLLARRYTNAQIGQALGISLDGAKWHVSEIIGILGVDSREEAADYWREYNGLPARLRRIASGIFAAPALLRTAAVAGGIAAVIAAGVIYASLRSVGEDDAHQPATPAATITAGAGSPPGNATPGPDTGPPGGETVAGVPVRPLTIATASAEFPKDAQLYYGAMAYQSEGNPNSLIRTYRNAAGELVRDDLFAPLQQYGQVYSWRADFDRGLVVAAVCTHGYCGGMAAADPDATSQLYRSTDGGVTWNPLGGPLPRETFLVAATDDGAVLLTWDFSGQQPARRLWQLPSGQDVAAPSGSDGEPSFVRGIGLVWRAASGGFIDAGGNPVAGGFVPTMNSPNASPSLVTAFPNGDVLVAWSSFADKTYEEQPWNVYYAVVGQSGTVKQVWSYPGNQDIRAEALISPTLLLGNIALANGPRSVTGFDVETALIDIEHGTVTAIPEVAAGMGIGGNTHPFTVGATGGPVLRVTNAGDCLNVRAQPDTAAPVLSCYADNVLLRDRGDSREADGITWLAVATPDGREGWASAEFLTN
ncbi:MAG: LuxR C-terminal-related transcriptional regulator [Hyphomicrobiales bacterium]